MNHEMPAMASSAHTHTIYAGGALAGQSSGLIGLAGAAPLNQFAQQALAQQYNSAKEQAKAAKPKEPIMAAAVRRLVQVFIADANENVPLESSLLYSGEQKLTDATDQELFFELDIKTLLEDHNKKRVKLIDKKVKERTEYLEPAKVRDLKMTVVTIASF